MTFRYRILLLFVSLSSSIFFSFSLQVPDSIWDLFSTIRSQISFFVSFTLSMLNLWQNVYNWVTPKSEISILIIDTSFVILFGRRWLDLKIELIAVHDTMMDSNETSSIVPDGLVPKLHLRHCRLFYYSWWWWNY